MLILELETDVENTDNEQNIEEEDENTAHDVVDPDKRREIIQLFDTTCDLCTFDMKSLKGAISHYRTKHNIKEGYIKCCGLKLKRDKFINDHIRWHINPAIFK